MGRAPSKVDNLQSRVERLEKQQHNIVDEMLSGFEDLQEQIEEIRPRFGITNEKYDMKRNKDGKVGFCLLLNNSTSKRSNARTSIDHLKQSFVGYHFDIGVQNVRVMADIRDALNDVVESSNKYSCIVVAMISPGKVSSGKIRLYDQEGNDYIALREMWTPFSLQKKLAHVPKLFFFEIEFDETPCPDELREDQYPGKAVEQQDMLLAHSVASPDFLETIGKLLKRAINQDVSFLLERERGRGNETFHCVNTLKAEVYFTK